MARDSLVSILANPPESNFTERFFRGQQMRNQLAELARTQQIRGIAGQALLGEPAALNELAVLDPKTYMDIIPFREERKKEERRERYRKQFETDIKGLESEGDYQVENKKGSGAYGAYQFMPDTFRGVATRHPDLKLPMDVTQATPEQQDKAFRAFTDDNAAELRRLGVPNPGPLDLYLAHRFGATGASRLRKLHPSMPMRDAMDYVFGLDKAKQVARQNPDVTQGTIGDFITKYSPRVAGAPPIDAAPPAVTPPATIAPVAPPPAAAPTAAPVAPQPAPVAAPAATVPPAVAETVAAAPAIAGVTATAPAPSLLDAQMTQLDAQVAQTRKQYEAAVNADVPEAVKTFGERLKMLEDRRNELNRLRDAERTDIRGIEAEDRREAARVAAEERRREAEVQREERRAAEAERRAQEPKPSTGYQWKNPERKQLGVMPIPGSEGEKIDSEVAARMGLSTDFFLHFPEIELHISEGGFEDEKFIHGWLGRGRPGEIQRWMWEGGEALFRLLTGAGRNKFEAYTQALNYQPMPWDDNRSMVSKMRALYNQLASSYNMVARGRGLNPVELLPNVSPFTGPGDVGGYPAAFKSLFEAYRPEDPTGIGGTLKKVDQFIGLSGNVTDQLFFNAPSPEQFGFITPQEGARRLRSPQR